MQKSSNKLDQVNIYRWSEVEKEMLTPLLDRQMIYGQRIMLSHLKLRKGCVVALHSHDNEQFSYVLEGALRFWYGQDELQVIDIRPGKYFIYHPMYPTKPKHLKIL